MAEGPKRAPGRWLVPPSKGAPTMTTSAPSSDAGSSTSARGTPRKVYSGPYMVKPPAFGSGADMQGLQAAEDVGRLPGGLGGRGHVGQAGQQGPERQLQLQAPEGCPQAVVDAGPEAEVLGRARAGQVEAVGVVEHRRVAVGRAEQQPQLGSLGHGDPGDLDVLQDPAFEHLQGGVVAQQLLDGPGEQAGVLAEPLQLVGVAEQLPPADAGEV